MVCRNDTHNIELVQKVVYIVILPPTANPTIKNLHLKILYKMETTLACVDILQICSSYEDLWHILQCLIKYDICIKCEQYL